MDSYLAPVSWETVRHKVQTVNPTLAHIIDALSPDQSYKLYKIRFPFGSLILRKGLFHVPLVDGRLVPLNDPRVDRHVRDDLGYHQGSSPVGMNLHHTTEAFQQVGPYTISPYGLIPPGRIMHTESFLNLIHSQWFKVNWDMTAGARSLFMLPKISNKRRHQRLQKLFYVKAASPINEFSHWKIFSQLSRHAEFGSSWETEILYFSKQWFDSLQDTAWQPFRCCLLEAALQNRGSLNDQLPWDWILSLVQQRKQLKPYSAHMGQVQHILMVALGALPAFSPATDDSAGPIRQLQKAYTDVYRLETYAPIILHLNSLKDSQPAYPVYCSLHYPTAANMLLFKETLDSKITAIDQVRYVMQKYLTVLLNNPFREAHPLTSRYLDKIQFDYFHHDIGDHYTGIRECKEMPREDDRFRAIDQMDSNMRFPEMRPFLKGCVRIQRNPCN